MAPVLSKLRPERAVLGITSVGVLYWLAKQCAGGSTKRRPQQAENDVTFVSGQKPEKKERVQVDTVFLGRLLRIFKIMVPGWLTAEAGYMGLILLCLFLRTYCDVWMIHNGTSIERSIIGDDKRQFKLHLGAFMTAMPLISVVNSVLKYSLNELKLRLRTKLTSHLYTQYLSEFTYYTMSNLDNRIANADQLLTQDVEKFCDSFTEWYSNISKPILDIIVYIYKLSSSLGPTGPLSLIGYMVFAGTFLNRIRRPIARHTVTEQRLEGEFRFVNSRLIISSEEIAFYRGSKREKATIDLSFKQLINHLRRFIHFKFLMGFMESIVGKYAATVVGYLVVSRPFLNPTHHLASASHNDRLEDYYRSGRMLIKLAEAIGRVVLAGREMTRLAGFTARVTELMNVLKDLQNGKYVRTMINQNGKSMGMVNGSVAPRKDLVPGRGKIIHKDNIIRFDKVPLVTPNGDMLIEELNFEVHSGMNVLVCGPNGCGKSSLFRTLGELWPLFGGLLTKPDPGKLFYIPQKPYMTLGTLRDQVLYPDGQEEQRKKGVTDSDLLQYLDLVQLNYLLDREGGWDAIQDWMDVLSGGEKQRIAMARLFYHKPQFAILDECTSAVSVDVEGSMYQYCREVGITLFTVSHRKSLWKHHEYFLHMDGRGSYEFKEIAEDTQEFGS